MAWHRPGDKPLSEPMMAISTFQLGYNHRAFPPVYLDAAMYPACCLVAKCSLLELRLDDSRTDLLEQKIKYRETSNIRVTLIGYKIVDHSNVVGASPVGAAPTTSSFSTKHLASKDWAKTTNCKARQEAFKFWDLVRLIIEVWWYALHPIQSNLFIHDYCL